MSYSLSLNFIVSFLLLIIIIYTLCLITFYKDLFVDCILLCKNVLIIKNTSNQICEPINAIIKNLK